MATTLVRQAPRRKAATNADHVNTEWAIWSTGARPLDYVKPPDEHGINARAMIA
jgi:hypothetical protein